MSILTIATDYGTADGLTAAMKGVIKSIAPETEIIDVTDELPSVMKASLVLTRYYNLFPVGTVHLMVVDPTVGSDRRAIFGTNGGCFLVGPDNGVFTRVIAAGGQWAWYEILIDRLPAREISNTFHGRDIFAPAAALVSKGVAPGDIGKSIGEPVTYKLPMPVTNGNISEGEIIDIDSFGNLIINITEEQLGNNPKVTIGGKTIPVGKTFSDVPLGRSVAYVGSLGFLEIAINQGRADASLGARIGSKVKVII